MIFFISLQKKIIKKQQQQKQQQNLFEICNRKNTFLFNNK
jgi:hypothetical protein